MQKINLIHDDQRHMKRQHKKTLAKAFVHKDYLLESPNIFMLCYSYTKRKITITILVLSSTGNNELEQTWDDTISSFSP